MYSYSLDPKYRLKRIRLIADYQFGKGVGKILFEDGCNFIFSKTRRIKQILNNNIRIATIRSNDGFIVLSIDGAKKIHNFIKYPLLRVVISDESVPFASLGKTVFSKFIISLDNNLRCKDEVLIVDKKDNLIAVGQLLLSPLEIINSNNGAAVNVRTGIKNNNII